MASGGKDKRRTQPAAQAGRKGRVTRRRFNGWALGLAVGAPLAVAAQSPQNPPPPVDPFVLRQAATDPRVRRFYARRGWSAAWTEDQAFALNMALDGAVRHGLDAAAFQAPKAGWSDPASREAALTLTALAYAEALSRGIVDPASLHPIYTLERNTVDVVGGLDRALSRGEVATWLEALAPRDPEYLALSAAYLRSREEMALPPSAQVAAGPEIGLGDYDARVPRVAQKLIDRGFVTGPAGQEVTLTAALVEGLKRVQASSTLPVTGRLDALTIATLNADPTDRGRKLVLNLERRRWLRREVADTRIDVNTCGAVFSYYDQGAVDWAGRAVCGSPGRATPNLGSTFSDLVVNPPWNVPPSIAAREILPRGLAYLRRANMFLSGGRVVQRPGPHSALGQVKFNMQNPYAIYLHDTPEKSLFATFQRHKSHGCVRVENAVDFARHLAQRSGVQPEFDADLASGATRRVALAAPIPVRLLYHSVVIDDGGQPVFLEDPYGWDSKLSLALGLGALRRPVRMDALTPEEGTAPLGP
ncbi:L,D-transpeptidase family protein [Phenylobacterium aquaticum]|uniref:L,D-transpeptidase family protein n=1 Tax=Phenylobacterium aquaticum TaxID=1763816 RepID=UPI0026EA192B|nr:L,D-transpeptidase family protein [Phenylobacterium aquaticum]